MAGYPPDNYQPQRSDRPAQPPYPRQNPNRYDQDMQKPQQSQFDPPRYSEPAPSNLPPPPMGEALRPAMKRKDSRSRLPRDTRPEFPDEASYLGGRAPDLEAKNHPEARRFRDKRDGYESDEGEALRQSKPPRAPRPPHGEYDSRAPPSDDRPPRRGAHDNYPPDDERPRRRDPYDDRRQRPRSQREPYYDEDEERPARRRRDKSGVEYGSEPIPVRRRQSERRPPPSRRRRDYDDEDDDDSDETEYRPRRRRSHEDVRRPPRASSSGGHHRRADSYDDRRHQDRNRRRYDDDDDDDEYSDRDDDRHDRRDRDRDRDRNRDRDRDRDRDRRRPPKEIKIGGFDVGPLVEKGQKHYSTLAPIVTPLVLSMARKYLGGSASGGSTSGGRSRR